MRNDPEPGGCAMVGAALLMLGFVYAVAAYVWTEHRQAVGLGGALVAALAAVAWLTGRAERRAHAAERRGRAAEAATVAAMTPAERDAEIIKRTRAVVVDRERAESRRRLAQTRADEAVRDTLRANGFGERCSWAVQGVRDDIAGGVEIHALTRAEHGGLLQAHVYVWDDRRPPDVELGYVESP